MTALSLELLEGLRGRLVRLGVPFDDLTNPGLSPGVIYAATQPLELVLPKEAVAWWSWRNGAPWGKDVLPGWRRFCPLEDAIAQYEQARGIAANIAPDFPHGDADAIWKPEWFPLDDAEFCNVVDCGGEPSEQAPIRNVTFEALPEENEAIRLPALGDLVVLWCEAIDSGAWQWDAARRGWERDLSRLPDRSLTALA